MKPSIEAQKLVSGFRAYQMVVAACRLQLPDLVADGPKTADELAASTGTHRPSLHESRLAVHRAPARLKNGECALVVPVWTDRGSERGAAFAVLGGKERTPDDYRELLARAGLRMTRLVPTESEFGAIEAVAAS